MSLLAHLRRVFKCSFLPVHSRRCEAGTAHLHSALWERIPPQASRNPLEPIPACWITVFLDKHGQPCLACPRLDGLLTLVPYRLHDMREGSKRLPRNALALPRNGASRFFVNFYGRFKIVSSWIFQK